VSTCMWQHVSSFLDAWDLRAFALACKETRLASSNRLSLATAGFRKLLEKGHAENVRVCCAKCGVWHVVLEAAACRAGFPAVVGRGCDVPVVPLAACHRVSRCCKMRALSRSLPLG
jgi:hypothetical protein